MEATKEKKANYCYAENEDSTTWDCGYSSREEAIEAARDEGEYESFVTGIQGEITFESISHDPANEIDIWIENMTYSAREMCGEAAQDNIELPEEKKKELSEIILKYLKENIEIACWPIHAIEYHNSEEES